jgi:hypothetical protein
MLIASAIVSQLLRTILLYLTACGFVATIEESAEIDEAVGLR